MTCTCIFIVANKHMYWYQKYLRTIFCSLSCCVVCSNFTIFRKNAFGNPDLSLDVRKLLLFVGELSTWAMSKLHFLVLQAQFDASELITQRELVSQRVNTELTERASQFGLILDDISLVSSLSMMTYFRKVHFLF